MFFPARETLTTEQLKLISQKKYSPCFLATTSPFIQNQNISWWQTKYYIFRWATLWHSWMCAGHSSLFCCICCFLLSDGICLFTVDSSR